MSLCVPPEKRKHFLFLTGMLLRTVVIDDNPIDLDIACDFVKKLDFLDLAASLSDPLEALSVIKSISPDILICDVEMPDLNGLALVKTLSPQPQVIFTTSFPDFAVQGFELNAVDYLVKPFSFERFVKAINRAVEQYSFRNQSREASPGKADNGDHFFVRSEHRFVRIEFSEVQYVEAMKDYVKIVTPSQTILTAITLKVIEDQLPAKDFIRIHRSFIANVNRIEAILNLDVVIGGATIPVGESYKEELYNSVVARKLIKR
jgi:DNA-binding LytR/AlgR family response regulator